MNTWIRRTLAIPAGLIALCCTGIQPARAGDFGIGAEGSFTYRWGDEEAYAFNTMNRGDNPFAPFRMTLLARAGINEDTDLFLEVPIEPTAQSSMWLTYLRPFVRLSSLGGNRWMNMQAGKLPTVYGTFGERSMSPEAGLIGKPLLFSYHTAIRFGIVPSGPDFFLQPGVRGGGSASYSDGTTFSFAGMPLIYDACWDTGMELFGMHQGLQFSAAATHGTVSRPASRVENYNDGYGFVGRLGYQVTSGPLFGLRMGVSGSFGPYLETEAAGDPSFPAGAEVEDYLNTSLGFDLSYATGPWQFQSELGQVGYEVPNVDPTLTATAYYLELTRDFGPSWSLAVRQEAVLFSDLTSTAGATESWDYDLWRWETGLNFRFRQGTRFRLGYQASRFPDAPDLNADLFALQLQVWTR
jgi:hypothetical protein